MRGVVKRGNLANLELEQSVAPNQDKQKGREGHARKGRMVKVEFGAFKKEVSSSAWATQVGVPHKVCWTVAVAHKLVFPTTLSHFVQLVQRKKRVYYCRMIKGRG